MRYIGAGEIFEVNSVISVTGASGFVGAALCGKLNTRGFAVRGAVRTFNFSFSASGVSSPI